MSERKVFTYKDVEEAKKYIGKQGWFGDTLYKVADGKGDKYGTLTLVGCRHHYFEDEERAWQFFSPDPEPVKKLVPFTAEDWELFYLKPVRHKSWEITATAITGWSDYSVSIAGFTGEPSFTDFMERWVFLDGSPCGKEIEE